MCVAWYGHMGVQLAIAWNGRWGWKTSSECVAKARTEYCARLFLKLRKKSTQLKHVAHHSRFLHIVKVFS